MINMKLTGIKIFTKGVDKAVKQASLLPRKRIGAKIQATARKSMAKAPRVRGAGSGRDKETGRFAKRKGTRIPSDPGTPPNRRTHNLANSIQVAHVGDETIIGPTMKYAGIHEQTGDPGGSTEVGGRTYPARPFMKPALRKTQDSMAEEFRNLKLAQSPSGRRLNARRLRP
jgi:phage gpG-like protein